MIHPPRRPGARSRQLLIGAANGIAVAGCWVPARWATLSEAALVWSAPLGVEAEESIAEK